MIIVVMGIGVTLIVAGACIFRFFNINFNGYEEILVMVAFWLYMIGCTYGTCEKTQITADILIITLPDKLPKAILIVVRDLFTAILCGVMMVWAMNLFLWSVEMRTETPVFRLPVGIGQISIFVGLLLSLFYNLCYLYDGCKSLYIRFIRKEPPPGGDPNQASPPGGDQDQLTPPGGGSNQVESPLNAAGKEGLI
jgi:TRAP-type C4-dicarboxylate transport system permease small subunit